VLLHRPTPAGLRVHSQRKEAVMARVPFLMKITIDTDEMTLGEDRKRLQDGLQNAFDHYWDLLRMGTVRVEWVLPDKTPEPTSAQTDG
jgi:hypothetical protein